MSILERIVSAKRKEIEHLRTVVSRDALERSAERAAPPLSIASRFRKGGRSVIAEIKRASPSRGLINGTLDAAVLAREYERAGATGISVLTDRTFFAGEKDDVRKAREVTSIPLLRKDFILDDLQVLESRALGADMVLLIVRILARRQVEGLLAAVRMLGMEALVEVHTREELATAVDAGATVIGVNSRDLDTFDVSLDTAASLRGGIPSSVLAVSESGIQRPDDARRMFEAGFDAVLVGEGLVRAQDRAAFIAGARHD